MPTSVLLLLLLLLQTTTAAVCVRVLSQLLSGHTNSKDRDLLVQRFAAELQVSSRQSASQWLAVQAGCAGVILEG
jgi:hypothetical protein